MPLGRETSAKYADVCMLQRSFLARAANFRRAFIGRAGGFPARPTTVQLRVSAPQRHVPDTLLYHFCMARALGISPFEMQLVRNGRVFARHVVGTGGEKCLANLLPVGLAIYHHAGGET
jgi:hypothetical protein